jgi:hypothetical protein
MLCDNPGLSSLNFHPPPYILLIGCLDSVNGNNSQQHENSVSTFFCAPRQRTRLERSYVSSQSRRLEAKQDSFHVVVVNGVVDQFNVDPAPPAIHLH